MPKTRANDTFLWPCTAMSCERLTTIEAIVQYLYRLTNFYLLIISTGISLTPNMCKILYNVTSPTTGLACIIQHEKFKNHPHVTDLHILAWAIATSSESSDHITAIRLNTQCLEMEIAGWYLYSMSQCFSFHWNIKNSAAFCWNHIPVNNTLAII